MCKNLVTTLGDISLKRILELGNKNYTTAWRT